MPDGDGPRFPPPPPLGVALLQEVATAALIMQGKRTKTVAAASIRSSSRSRGAKASLPAMQRAQLLQAQKNLEISGNSPPRFTILNTFSDDHLVEVLEESGVDVSCIGGTRELLPLLNAAEQAQAAIVATVVARADQSVQGAGASHAQAIRPDEGVLATGVAPLPRLAGPRRGAWPKQCPRGAFTFVIGSYRCGPSFGIFAGSDTRAIEPS